MNGAHRPRLRALLPALILLLVTAWLYAPAVNFGFFWDDPLWYGRIPGKSLRELVGPTPSYQFYRPGLMLYNRLFLRSDGTFGAPLMHAAQIGWHLLNIAFVFALCRRLGLKRWMALAIAGLAAWHPFSHQAVAWAAPSQVPATALQDGAWLAYVQARRRRTGHHLIAGLSLLLFVAALTISEATISLAVLPLLLEWVLRQQGFRKTGWQLSLTYPAIAAGFGLLWFLIPRQGGIAGLAFEPRVMAYLLQGFIFPLLGRPTGYAPEQPLAPGTLAALAGITVSVILAVAWRTGRGHYALLGLIWAVLGIAPAVAGLRHSYASLASRMLYHSAAGVALLWTCAVLPSFRNPLVRRLWRAGGLALIGLIMLQSLLLLSGFQRMYTVGTDHLAELIRAAQAGNDRMLVVNFPDRYAPRRPPYPLGYWGVTLAPVSVDLGAFPAIATGRHPYIVSCNMPWLDKETRDVGPYQIDVRGAITPPDELYALAHQMDAIYLSRYHPDGSFELFWAGAITSVLSADSAADCQMAVFGDTLCLHNAQIDPQPEQLKLTLTWVSLGTAQPHDTIFVHLGQPDHPPIAQADGDAWLGMLPLTSLQPGDTIREQRIIQLPEGIPAGQYEIRIGVYNRISGERLPATTPQGEPLPSESIVVGHFSP